MSDIFIKLILSLIFGATVGLERQSNDQSNTALGGIRAYALFALLGSVSGLLFVNNQTALGLLISGGVIIFMLLYYFLVSPKSDDYGIASEISAIITYLLGLLLMLDIVPLQLTVAIFVILMFILSLKSRTSQLVAGVSPHEMQSFISYAIIALVVLPVLPDTSYKLQDIPVLPELMQGLNIDMGKFSTLDLINPQKIWMVVVLITGIDVFGYILSRMVGSKKGFSVTSFMAGFVSSTSATQSLAQRSKTTEHINHLIGAAVLANLASFFQIFLLVGPLNSKWLVSIAPAIFLMIITAGIIAFIFLKRKEPVDTAETEQKKVTKIFSLMPALKFAGILIMVKIGTKICLILFGQSGFIISSVIASFAGIDAIMVNLADMAGTTITFKFAFITFILVNATNLLSKTLYSFLQGKRKFAMSFLFSALAIIAASTLWLFFI